MLQWLSVGIFKISIRTKQKFVFCLAKLLRHILNIYQVNASNCALYISNLSVSRIFPVCVVVDHISLLSSPLSGPMLPTRHLHFLRICRQFQRITVYDGNFHDIEIAFYVTVCFPSGEYLSTDRFLSSGWKKSSLRLTKNTVRMFCG